MILVSAGVLRVGILQVGVLRESVLEEKVSLVLSWRSANHIAAKGESKVVRVSSRLACASGFA